MRQALHDAKLFPKLGKPQLAAAVCFVMCMIGLIFVTRAGVHWLELFDGFAVNVTLFVVGALECIAIGCIYGVNRFAAVSRSKGSNSCNGVSQFAAVTASASLPQ